MFKKLEEEKPMVAAEEETPKAECPCACTAESNASEDPAPPINRTKVDLAVYFDING